jgi:hypothetical protein
MGRGETPIEVGDNDDDDDDDDDGDTDAAEIEADNNEDADDVVVDMRARRSSQSEGDKITGRPPFCNAFSA